MKLLLITDQNFGYGIGTVSIPFNKTIQDLIKNITNGHTIYAESMSYHRLSEKHISNIERFRTLIGEDLDNHDDFLMIDQGDLSDLEPYLDEIVLLCIHRSYPKTDIFTMFRSASWCPFPTEKYKYKDERGRTIEEIHYRRFAI